MPDGSSARRRPLLSGNRTLPPRRLRRGPTRLFGGHTGGVRTALTYRKRRRVGPLLAVGLVVLLLLAGCTSHKSHDGAIKLPATINGVRLDPPPPGTKPALSEEDARTVLSKARDLTGASRVASVLALVTTQTTDHVLAWVFVGYDVPFVGLGPRGPTGKATVVEPVSVPEGRVLFSALSQTS